MTMEKLLHRVEALRAASDGERLAFLEEEQIFLHSKMARVLDTLSAIIEGPNPEKNYRAIVARSFSGKSTHAEQLQKRYPIMFNPLGDSAEVPVVLISMPPKASLRELCFRILRAIGEPMHTRAEGDHVISCAYQSLISLKTRALIIDEFQDIEAGMPREKQPVANFVKEIGHECKLAVFCFGTPKVPQVLQAEPQLRNRFKYIPIRPFRADEVETREVLQMFEIMIPLRKQSDLADRPELIDRILQLSDGLIGHMRAVVYCAAATAIETGREVIDLKTIDAMIKSEIWLPATAREETVIEATGAKREDLRPILM